MPRSVRLLFDLIKQESSIGKKKFTVYCSYLQVYKEKIYDLLNKSHLKRLLTDGPGLKLKFVKDYFPKSMFRDPGRYSRSPIAISFGAPREKYGNMVAQVKYWTCS